MKVLKIIIVLVFVCILYSCNTTSVEDIQPQLTNTQLSGMYTLTYLNSTTVETRQVNGGTIISTIDISGDSFTDAHLVLNENGSYTFNRSYRITETTTVTGNPTQTKTYVVSKQDEGNYSIDQIHNQITLSGRINDILNYDSNVLNIRYSNTTNNEDVTTEFSEELRFSR